MRFNIYRGDSVAHSDVSFMFALETLHAFAQSVDPEYATRAEIAEALRGGYCGLARGSSVAPMVAIEAR